jgi:WD40 repeat protein
MNNNINTNIIIKMEVILSEIAKTRETVKETIRYWQKVLDELDRRAEEYEEIYKNMKEAEEEDKRRRDVVELNIKLNLRGQVFDTTKDILVNNSPYFSLLFSSPSFELDANGEFFIDRNSHCFDRILDYMSTGVLSTEGLNRYDKDCLYDNRKFFMIPEFSRVRLIDNLKLVVHLQLKDCRLCGANEDNNIVVYNMDTNTIDMTLEGHIKDVNAIIQLEDGRICSCSDDDTIKLWNSRSGRCELTLVGHYVGVSCILQLMDGRLCSGSADYAIRIWNKDTGVCEFIIEEEDYIKCIVQLKDGRVCCGQYEGNIKTLNLTSGSCEMTINAHQDYTIQAIVVGGSRIYTCSHDITIKVWNANTGVCEGIFKGHKNDLRDMILLHDGRLCSASCDNTVKIWNTYTFLCEVNIPIVDVKWLCTILQLKDGRLVTTSLAGEVFIIY